jgi:hypothetical protein
VKSHTFSVSEVLKDGRVMVFTYVRQGSKVSALMQVFDENLQKPVTALEVTMPGKLR